jgi:hypothetical protein
VHQRLLHEPAAEVSQAATRESWKNLPFPEARAALPFRRAFDAGEHARLVRGVVPGGMDDKWFILYEAPWLLLHRSWTGICIYAVRLRHEGEGSAVEEAWANRDPKEYRLTDDEHDARVLSFLVDRLLLGRDVPFPVREEFDPARAELLAEHVVGRRRTGD